MKKSNFISQSDVHHLSFNQDFSCIAVGTRTGFSIYNLNPIEVLSTAPNPLGLAALSTESSSYLIFPSGTGGSVVLYDCITLRLLSQIDAHKSPVAAVQFNSTGTVLATASSTGTVIRLFSVPSGSHLCTFRRGSRPSAICSMSFSSDSSVLAVASSSGTVHLFDVESALRRLVLMASPTPPPPPSTVGGDISSSGRSSSSGGEVYEGGAAGGGSWTSSAMSYLSMAQSWGVAAVGGLGQAVLPEPVQEYAESIRAVALARLPLSTVQAGGGFIAGVVSCSSREDEANAETEAEEGFKIVVVTQKRQLFRYAVPKNMGELTAAQRKGDESSVVECTLEDEALLDC